MALGFRDCCNSSSYFYLNGIPGSVSPNDVYEIITLEGPTFCATYTTVPILNYSPPTYNLVEMTMQDNSTGSGCANCIANNPCPSVQNIQLSQFGPGSIATGTDCDIRAMYPMSVNCDITNPSFDGFADGEVRLVVTGGTYPYTFFSAGTNPAVYFGSANPDPNAPAPPDNTYIIIANAAEGVYNITTVDAQADYVVNTTCILDSPPAPLEVTVNASLVSIIGECDGALSISIDGGTPPYTVSVNSIPVITNTLTNLCAGDYEIVVIDSGEFPNQQVVTTNSTIGAPLPLNYPTNLCFTVGEICSTTFNLDFQLQVGTVYNLRAVYTCTNPQVLGLSTLLLRWEENVNIGVNYTGWGIGLPFQLSNGNVSFNAQCNQSPVNSFVRFTKIDPQTELPIGNYTTDVGFLSGLIGTIAQGTCAEVGGGGGGGGGGGNGGGGGGGPLAFTFQAVPAPCGQQSGSVVIVAQGGTPPYTYFTNNGGGPVSSAVPTIPLTLGNYTAYVVDSLGEQSAVLPFTITQLATTPINITFNSVIDTTDVGNYNEQIPAVESIGFGGNPDCTPNCGNIQINRNTMSEFNYPINIDINISGLGPGQTIQGYFILTLKLQNVFSLSSPVCVSSIDTFNLLGGSNGFIFNGTGYANTPGATTDNIFKPRPTNINAALLTASQSTGCVSALSVDDLDILFSDLCNIPVANAAELYSEAQDVWDASRVQTKIYNVGSAGSPITLSNGSGTFNVQFNGRFRPTNETCPPAKGFQWEIQFIRTSTDIVCTTLNFNGATYVPGGTQRYRASVKQVGAQNYPNIISTTQIIN